MGFLDKLRGRITGQSSTDPKAVFMVAGILRSTPSVGVVTANPAKFAFQIKGSNGREHTLFLENLFVETRELPPSKRADRVRALVTDFGAPEASELAWEDVKSRLVPLLRPSTAFVATVVDATKLPIARSFLPFLIEAVGIDSEHTMQFVIPSTVEAWGVTVDEVFDVARTNASDYFGDGDIASYDPHAPYPIWHVAKDDSYESSRLLLPGWLASFRGKVTGRPVAIVPERAKLIVGGDGDERCLRRLIDTAVREYAACYSTPHSI